ncbi:MAG: hypothetical protein KDJ52_24320 [Anaerolineae bacterium]|nr:hypothetical protein [Anaerolineae bacterium]
MMLLSLLLLVNAVLHGVIIGRFGIKGNEPPAVFGVLYAVLALAVFRGWTYGVLATLVVTTVGLVGLALNFRKLQHDTTVEKIIFVVGAAILAWAAYLILAQ